MGLPFYLETPTPDWYAKVPWVTLDFETTNREKGDPRNVHNRLVKICVDGKVVDESALKQVFKYPCVLVAHNAKFELGWLIRYGIDMSKILVFDTMIAEYVLNGNRGGPLDLDSLSRKYGFPGKERVIDRMMKGGVCPSEMPEHWLEARVRQDVMSTAGIAACQYMRLKEAGLLPVFFTRCILTPVLAFMEREGLTLDAQKVGETYRAALADRTRLRIELDQATGGINLRSVKQKAEFLYDTLGFAELTDRDGVPRRTESGGRLTDVATLEALKATTDEQRHFLRLYKEFAKVDASLTKVLEFFQGVCEEHGGVFFGQYNQCVTQTHRLSSNSRRMETRFGERGAQLHNTPRALKSLVCASNPDSLVIEADAKQLEFRTAVDLARDEQGLMDVSNDVDVHRFTASVLFQILEDAVTKEQRQSAKPSTFKPLYGGMSGTKREVEYFAAFRKKYPSIDRMQRGWLTSVLRDKCLRMPGSGLIFYWPDTRITPSGYITNTPSIFNYPVQSFATADIIPIMVVYLFWLMRERVRFLNTIHDSVVAEVPKHAVRAYANVVNTVLSQQVPWYLQKVYGYETIVPLGGEVYGGRHWTDDTIKYEFDHDNEGEWKHG